MSAFVPEASFHCDAMVRRLWEAERAGVLGIRALVGTGRSGNNNDRISNMTGDYRPSAMTGFYSPGKHEWTATSNGTLNP